MSIRKLSVVMAILMCVVEAVGAEKPPLTLDEFFNSVYYDAVEISPDGHAVVIGTTRPDWEHNRYRSDLWLYRDEGGGSLLPLTQSGHDSKPQWSPNGRWIAFLSDRTDIGSVSSGGDDEDDSDAKPSKSEDQVYVISAQGGEAMAVTHGDEEVHALAWSADSRLIYFSTREPWTKEQMAAYKKEWNDVVRFRESERGDTIFGVNLAAVIAGHEASPEALAEPEKLSATPYRVSELAVSPRGNTLAFATMSRSEREESRDPYGIWLVDLPGPDVKETMAARLAVKLQAEAHRICWAPDGRRLFFGYENGNPTGPYEDVQGRIYSMGVTGGPPRGAPGMGYTRWAMGFDGAVLEYGVTQDGAVLAAARLGTEVELYTASAPELDLVKRAGWAGTYESFSAALRSPRIAYVYSTLDQPEEVYLAEGPDHLERARPLTSFNRIFTERALPEGKPYKWKADDGQSIEGMLIYPPGKFGAEHLPMLTFIHGGPDDADGNHFGADWYQWSTLAAADGWLVFEPNYRGSLGYGDKFAIGIIGPIVSRPGKDILEGVDALVKDGIADPDHLTVGGYSYGGYMTNWLITQTTRFKAAVTGAGAVENVTNWGNDDTTYDDAYFLGGVPWETEKNYNAEAAIWQLDKVTTPTHVVAGADDIRVYVGEDYLLERALYTRGVPTSLLIFPGEGHELDRNPWHGKIKVREELKWVDKYGR